MAAIAGIACHFVLLDKDERLKVVLQLTCLTLGRASGPAYSTGELLNTPMVSSLPSWLPCSRGLTMLRRTSARSLSHSVVAGLAWCFCVIAAPARCRVVRPTHTVGLLTLINQHRPTATPALVSIWPTDSANVVVPTPLSWEHVRQNQRPALLYEQLVKHSTSCYSSQTECKHAGSICWTQTISFTGQL